MHWFLERINTGVLPVTFGVRSQREHPNDFVKLLKRGVFKRVDNLSEVECHGCHGEQLWQIRNEKEEIFYICQNGCGKMSLIDNDVRIYEYNNNAFLKLLADELNIKTNDGTFSDEAAYSQNSFYHVGTYEYKTLKAEVYYLRTDAVYEPSSLFGHLGNNATKILITNTTKPTIVSGKDGTSYCVLADTLATPTSERVFDTVKFKKCFDCMRRVRFDAKQAQLFLDGTLVYTAGLNSPEHHFLACLWKRWQEQVPHDNIHSFVKEALGRDVSDTAQKFCNKMKSNIKKEYEGINGIITVPTTGYYMMANPV